MKATSAQIIVTLGISLSSRTAGRSVRLHARRPSARRLSSQAFQLGPWYEGATISGTRPKLVAFVVAVLAAVCSYLVLEYTRLGKALRAAADNPTAATYMGIDVDRSPHRLRPGLRHHRGRGGLMATYNLVRALRRFDYVIIMYSVSCWAAWAASRRVLGRRHRGFVQQFSALILPPQLQNARS